MLREADGDPPLPESFKMGVDSLSGLQIRPEIVLEAAPAPSRLAPYSHAVAATIFADDEEIGTGRFVVLHDPSLPAAWESDSRVVAYLEADVDAEMASDPLITEVAWTWVTECLMGQDADQRALGGTTTVVRSQSFEALSERGPEATVQIRCSWSPVDIRKLDAHAMAWVDMMAMAAGLPPMEPGVTRLG